MPDSENSGVSEEDSMNHEPGPVPNPFVPPDSAPLPTNGIVASSDFVATPLWTGTGNSQGQNTWEVGGGATQSSTSAVLFGTTPGPVPTTPVATRPTANAPTTLVTVHSTNRNDNGLTSNMQTGLMELGANIESENSMDEDDVYDEDDYDSDESFLEHMAPDVSAPSKDELDRMQRAEQISALDHGRWETRVYTSLDDPEYRPQAAGRISWILEGFHGTRASPNRSRIMRSPAVEIGGFKWNIKIFPRGNEGTDHVSVFVECTGPPTPESPPTSKENASIASENGVADHSTSHVVPGGNWEVAAQIGCVMYNPEEPRVHKFENTTHQFQHNNQDCGWVRFYGPWATLHSRRRDQLKPMLTNDRLAFTVYIRTIHDPTKALWWRQTEINRWNSLEKTGLRGLDSTGVAKNAVSAALAQWFHLIPFKRLIMEAPCPSSPRDSHRKPWQLFNALQNALYHKHQEDPSVVNLSAIEKILDWYVNKFSESTDVIEVWENLRFFLNEEYYRGHGTGDSCPDVLYFVKTIKMKHDPDISGQGAFQAKVTKPTAQSIIHEMSRGAQQIFQEWEGYTSSGQYLPQVLQIELPRQRYDSRKHEWKRLTHKIKIDDSVHICNVKYHLFGLVVSKGKLGSGKMYSIVRSSHISSQWARYKMGVVTYLTRRQAIDAHEGHGGSREGPESVAQVLIYIRADALGDVLPSGMVRDKKALMPPLPMPASLSLLSDRPKSATVVVHYASSFIGYMGLGILEPYQSFPGPTSGCTISNVFTRDSTLEDVADHLNETLLSEKSLQQFVCTCVHWSLPPNWHSTRPQRQGPAKLLDMTGFPRVHIWARLAPDASVMSSNVLSWPDGTTTHVPTRPQPSMYGRKEVFIKLYDTRAQYGPSIAGLTSFIGPYEQTIGEAIGKWLPENTYVIYSEQPTTFEVRRTKLTLKSTISNPEIKDTGILVLAAASTSLSPEQDRFSEIVEYYQSLRNREHWRYRKEVYRRSYFGGPYINAQLHHGLISGQGVKVATNGDLYRGMFRNGLIHGEGTMLYAGSNDVYTGSWLAERRFGQGKMVYGKTGNVYVGEWRDGRRHGSGTMSYKQADEELQMCHICYSNEIDALFYRCGHILACEVCARQCSECPICRRPVDAVVKIFDMRKMGV
jgi:hypothetical protein